MTVLDAVSVHSSGGRKICVLVATILAGGSHIDQADMLRAGARQRVLPFCVMAPSTLGTFLGTFTFGHVRQLDKVGVETLRRAWAAGAGPDDGPMTIDLDSTVCEVYGKQKHGAAYGYTHVLGYHPILATRADTGEVLHARLRKGSSQRGANRFVEELVARVRRAGAAGALVVRADSGFWSYQLIDTLDRLQVGWSITVNINPSIRACIHALTDDAWTPIDYPDGGQAAVAQTTYLGGGRDGQRREPRLVVRRSRLVDPIQAQLWPDWRYHAFITSLDVPTVAVDQFHRDHATVELAIRDLKTGAGLEHCPSGKFFANAAWLACAVLAHNLIRRTTRLGDVHPDAQLTVTRTIRTKLLALAGRIVNSSGRHTPRLPARWPWADTFLNALDKVRAPPAHSGRFSCRRERGRTICARGCAICHGLPPTRRQLRRIGRMDDVSIVRRRSRLTRLRGSSRAAMTAWRCWVICTVVGVLDAVTTWYGVRILHVKESNPLAQWGIAHIGLTATVTLRVVLGSVAVGLAALGAIGRLPREPRFVIRACRALLVLAVVLWSAVVVNNTVAIIQHHPLTS